MFKEANTPRFLRSLSNHSDLLGVFNRFHGRLTRLTFRESQIEKDWLNWLVLNFWINQPTI